MSVSRYYPTNAGVEAIQFKKNNTAKVAGFVGSNKFSAEPLNGDSVVWNASVYITPGNMWLNIAYGDWIVKNNQGHITVMNDPIFRQSYKK